MSNLIQRFIYGDSTGMKKWFQITIFILAILTVVFAGGFILGEDSAEGFCNNYITEFCECNYFIDSTGLDYVMPKDLNIEP